MNDLSKLLVSARNKRGLSQGDMAKLLGLKTAQSISNIERQTSPFPLKHTRKIARILRVHPRDIVNTYLDDRRKRIFKALGI